MRHRAIVPFGLLAVLLLISGAPGAGAAEPEVLLESWDAMRINGAPAGHAHSIVRKAGTAETPLIETTSTSHIEMARGSSKVVIDGTTVTRERPDGSLAWMRQTQSSSGVETVKEVTFGDGQARIATTSMGQTREATVKVPADTIGPWRVSKIVAEAGLREGATHDIRTFMLDMGGAVVQKIEVGAVEEVETLAGKQRLTRTKTTFGPIVSTSWVDAQGTPIVAKMSIAGMEFLTQRGTKEQVFADKASASTPPEVLEASLLKTRYLIPHARSADSALIHVRGKRPDVRLDGLEDERQKVEAKGDGNSVLVRVKRVLPPAGKTGTRPLASPTPEIAAYLAATSMLQADDPLIQAAAAEAVAGETDAWKAAQRIERWVFDAITDKNMDVAMGSALQVCKSKEGDCTEHAVLATALCRAVGIPARVVFGLEYLSGIFGGHAWHEVWIEGSWYALDATLGTGGADALHLALGRLALAEGAEGAELLELSGRMGTLDVDVREIGWNGQVLRLDRPDAVTVDGARYVDRIWGLAIDGPTGFEVRAREPNRGMSTRLVELRGTTPAGPRRVRVRAESLLPGQKLETTLPKEGTFAAGTIDGRPAQLGTLKKSDGDGHLAFVIDDQDSLFVFEWVPGQGAADADAFAAFLKTVDLDVETTVAGTPK